MTLAWAIVGVVVLISLVAVTRVIRRAVWVFSLAAIALLALRYQSDPAQATGALAALGGGLAVAVPLRAMIWRFFI
ncbi:hypothetical protein M8756_03545 [Lutimaribacter sp. EGI FJ00015]|uniref:Uncharacterized protein n=1 Tax=Lutimaribacter degradans TaxID=2945989 RepID=A0ACC5ZTE7_9RHOB|nr:hypothetical protein [Lutimaribacter sp. EGI FJ00013]MCM2560684.1 hypothetical protein [Lutimaribacter sp. EGI FJ00013]MCO0612372.1 hypothetical protein [Lutimaribacter sp. EGI FJ00015]MCO0634508.1 hypothetical protein [Lutimaribacter sp. EGI FJ00014]